MKKTPFRNGIGVFSMIFPFGNYSCSSLRVIVGWSQTSVGPQYWMEPG